jgi:hypothetical protein
VGTVFFASVGAIAVLLFVSYLLSGNHC